MRVCRRPGVATRGLNHTVHQDLQRRTAVRARAGIRQRRKEIKPAQTIGQQAAFEPFQPVTRPQRIVKSPRQQELVKQPREISLHALRVLPGLVRHVGQDLRQIPQGAQQAVAPVGAGGMVQPVIRNLVPARAKNRIDEELREFEVKPQDLQFRHQLEPLSGDDHRQLEAVLLQRIAQIGFMNVPQTRHQLVYCFRHRPVPHHAFLAQPLGQRIEIQHRPQRRRRRKPIQPQHHVVEHWVELAQIHTQSAEAKAAHLPQPILQHLTG